MNSVRTLLRIVLFLRMAGRGLLYLGVVGAVLLIVSALAGPFVTGAVSVMAAIVLVVAFVTWGGRYRDEVREISSIDWREFEVFRAARRAGTAAEVRR